MNRRPGRAGDHADGSRIFRQLLFLFGVKQALGRQLRLQLLKGRVQVPYTVHAHSRAIELVRAVSGVYGNSAQSDDLHAVGRPEAQAHGVSFEHDAFQGRCFVLQGKVMVSGWVAFVVADLATYRHLGEHRVRVHLPLNVFIDLGNGEYLGHITPPSAVRQAPPRPWHCL